MIPIAMAVIAIFIIGLDILLLWCFAVVNLFAMKYSNFNVYSLNLRQRYTKFFATDCTDFYRLKK
jgi:hypothetical protein